MKIKEVAKKVAKKTYYEMTVYYMHGDDDANTEEIFEHDDVEIIDTEDKLKGAILAYSAALEMNEKDIGFCSNDEDDELYKYTGYFDSIPGDCSRDGDGMPRICGCQIIKYTEGTSDTTEITFTLDANDKKIIKEIVANRTRD